MPVENPAPRPAPESQEVPAHPLGIAIRDHLQGKKEGIFQKIRNYPPPIPACDLQFNHLLEERDGVSRELARLDAIIAERLPPGEFVEKITRFIAASSRIAGEAARQFKADSKKSRSRQRR